MIANNTFRNTKHYNSLSKQKNIKNKRLTLPKSIKIK